MRALREMGGGLIIAVFSLLLVIGGISLSLAENTPPEQPTPTPLPPIIATSIELPTFTPIVASTNTPETSTPTLTSSPSPTLLLSVTCNPPAGWIQIVVSASDTLYTIAERYKTTAEILNSSNCLNNTIPATGSRLYVPPIPTVTVIPCGPYAGWIKAYTVRPGDNLYRISLLYRTSVQQLQRANCMGSSITIYTGQVLWVPNVPTSTAGITSVPNTATPNPTQPATSTSAPTNSPVPSSPTTAPTNTNIPPTATPSLTSFPSATPTTPSP